MKKEQIAFYFPEKVLENDELEVPFGKYQKGAVYKKIGIKRRHICGEHELISDMAQASALKLVKKYKNDIDFILLCTQTPDYELPTTACIVQEKLGLSDTVGAFDINLGCSGFIYSLAIAKGLLQSSISHGILLIMSDAYTKHIHLEDYSTRTIFGDASCSVFLTEQDVAKIGEFVFGTDGKGFDNLIIPASGAAGKNEYAENEVIEDISGRRTKKNLYMNGLEIFNFTLDRVPLLVEKVLEKNHVKKDEISLFIPHQANQFILGELRDILDIPENKFYINMEDIGNTVSASVPIALKMALEENRIEQGDKVMLFGFGVGYSWGGVVLTI